MTAELAPNLPGPLKDKSLLPQGALYYGLSQSILHVALDKVNQTPEEAVKMHGYRELPVPLPSEVPRYKAAPREGVWATPPFMHNGSVPNLYEMLVPAAKRTKKFYLEETSTRSRSGWIPRANPEPTKWTQLSSGARTVVTRSRTVLGVTVSSAPC